MIDRNVFFIEAANRFRPSRRVSVECLLGYMYAREIILPLLFCLLRELLMNFIESVQRSNSISLCLIFPSAWNISDYCHNSTLMMCKYEK